MWGDALSAWVPMNQQPKALTFLLTLPFLPRTRAAMLPYLFVGTATALVLHAISPRRVVVPLSVSEQAVVLMNLLLTLASAVVLIWLSRDGIYEVGALSDVPAAEVLLVVLWAFCDEVTFFCGHWLLHHKHVYRHVHKMHHKFKVTSAWTSFYAHPLDNLFVMWAALGAPAAMLRGGHVVCSAPVVALFMHVAVTTFIGSHHTTTPAGDRVKGGQSRAGTVIGTPHLQHHLHFNVNYGNFRFFDTMIGTADYDKKCSSK